ncbi:hypothetical protein [Rhizobium tumorigenes]|uniref:hypothetical protein n=1 Tax=Rhizobium tumorigenes TaxID=2041385 RepID=UPI00241DA1F5|nr:hypothetical protein [Rhizobium tumorigenes]WFS04460.1 hypothetical protein PR016_25710 [Rhizobium tumorigenes]
MSKLVVIRLPGESGLWLADLEAGTVTSLAVPVSGALKQASDLSAAGVTIVKGVDLAVAVSSTADVASGLLDG